mgnify:CR=1 FL=1
MSEKKIFVVLLAAFLAAYFIPFADPAVQNAIAEALLLLQDYARQHVILCLIPAFFIAGAISVFVSQASVIKYFGPQARKLLAYSVASVSGSILAVCSCTVLPLFAGIYTRGAGIGPATAFLYSGPAINVLAIILTAKVLGIRLGVARAVSAVAFSVIVGLLMHLIFRRAPQGAAAQGFVAVPDARGERPLAKTAAYFGVMVAILVAINWGKSDPSLALWYFIYRVKWLIGGILALVLAWMLVRWLRRDELRDWTLSTWIFAKQIFPLLFAGVLISGFLLGRPGHEGIIPGRWVERLVGGNSLGANLFASVAGALMYFATLTEVPILQGLLGSGMGQGPALALLLAGPALSLPSMLVIRQVMGTGRALAYIALVVVMSTIAGMIFGRIAA